MPHSRDSFLSLSAPKERTLTTLIAWVACGLVCVPVLLPDQVLFFRDHGLIFRRLLHEVLDAYSNFRLPLWDAMAAGGEPLAAYPAALAYSPFLALLGIGEFDLGYRLLVMAHVPVAMFGAYLLGRTARLEHSAATACGLLYGLSGAYLSFNNLLPTFESVTLGPWVLAMALRLAWAPSALNAVGFTISLALHVMVGDPVFLLIDVIVFFAAWLPGARNRPVLKELSLLTAAAVLAALLAAIQFIPLFELLRGSVRGTGFSYEQLAIFSLHPARLAELFVPGLSGDVSVAETLFSGQADGRLYLCAVYTGASALPLYLLATRIKSARLWLLIATGFLLVALGKFTPIHEVLIDLIPGLSSSRYPVKFMYGAQLALALAGGHAFQSWPAIPLSRLKRQLGLPVLACTMVMSAVFVFDPSWLQPFLGPGLSLDAGYGHVAKAASTGLIFMILASGLLMTGRRWLVLAVIAIDLSFAAQAVFPVAPATIFAQPEVYDLISQKNADTSVFLYDFFSSPNLIEHPTAVEAAEHQMQRLTPGLGVPLGVRYLLDPELNQVRSARWRQIEQLFRKSDEPTRIRLLGRFGVSHLLVEAGDGAPPGLVNRGKAKVPGGDAITAFRIQQSRPLVSLASSASIAQDREAALAMVSSSSALNHVTIEAEITRENPDLFGAIKSSFGSGSLQKIEHQPGHITATVTSTVPTLLIAAQSYNIGWKATLDKQPVAVFPVDVLLTGVFVPAGTHDISLKYQPATWSQGAALSGLALLIVVTLIGYGLITSRRRKQDQIPPS
jgi:hypothetical protein